jgi:hypothetical protein
MTRPPHHPADSVAGLPVGRTVWNVGSWFIPGVDLGKAAGKLGKLGRVGAEAGKLARLGEDADKAATKAEKAAAAGDHAAAEAAAKEARKVADYAGPGPGVAQLLRRHPRAPDLA